MQLLLTVPWHARLEPCMQACRNPGCPDLWRGMRCAGTRLCTQLRLPARLMLMGSCAELLVCQAGDKEFKKDMGLLVEVGLWERAALEAADLLTASKAQQMQLTGGQNVQLNQLAKLQAQVCQHA